MYQIIDTNGLSASYISMDSLSRVVEGDIYNNKNMP